MQAKAEAVNDRQTEFLSMLAHELRNPLAPISMAAELLGSITHAHPQLPKLHGIIQRQVSHMAHLVDDLVDASRISNGKITLQKRVLQLAEIIDGAVETSQPLINTRLQHLHLALPEEPIMIEGDLVRLVQVFSNLLINAAKFTAEDGHITVSAHRRANVVVVSVKDNGVGIGPALLPFVFDLFTQGPRSLDRAQGGLGIGLSMVHTLVALHGGTVKVESDGAGCGSEFSVSMPISTAALPEESSDGTETIPAHRHEVLLIEDSVDTNAMLTEFLTREGHTVTSAFDGLSGLARAKEHRYDVIVCDIGLPGIDGYEVALQLQHQPLKRPRLIAMTGYQEPENKKDATGTGFDHYLVKPVAMHILRNLVSMGASQP
jgi:CheY-like chemotaxis protein